ncbi:hypothetical protein [Streptomyces sp. x-19]|uniref:hypothetical protein n=1 Tax=Streptomyces sp. x-19 TaxID=2789280 RepID=UPI00397EC3EB
MHALFQPLPAPNRDQAAHDTAEALRDRPGQWARIETLGNPNRAANLAYRIRTGRHTAFQPAGAFEATARSSDDGTASVYARYTETASETRNTH